MSLLKEGEGERNKEKRNEGREGERGREREKI